jgi:vancomycin permeability regulator SanA
LEHACYSAADVTTLAHTTARSMSRREWSAASRARERAQAVGGMRLWPRDAARGVALFLGLFSLLNLIGELRTPGFDENIWWLDLRPLQGAATALVFALAGVLLLWWGLRPAASRWRRVVTAATALVLSIVAIHNGVTFYHAWQQGQIRPWMPLPLSFVLAAALLWIAWAAARPAPAAGRNRWAPLLVAAVVVLCGILFPLAQQVFFGKTDYVRPAQVAVVFGAEVHADGHPSVSLRDRVRTATQLYKAGLAQRLLMSGAQGAGEPINETTAMRTLALQFGVPASAIELDPKGFNTDATVRDTLPIFRATGAHNVAVVSDFFHLPRVKLAYQRFGYNVITVPSRAHRIPQTTKLVLREIPAFWVYYLRAVLR